MNVSYSTVILVCTLPYTCSHTYMYTFIYIGMMENSPVTYVECLFTIFSIGTGVIIYAYILSAATNALRNMNSVEDEASQKFQRVQMYLNQKKIPQPLQMKIKDYYDYINSRTFNHSDVLDGLHYRLRSELNYHTHISLVKKVHMYICARCIHICMHRVCVRICVCPGKMVVV